MGIDDLFGTLQLGTWNSAYGEEYRELGSAPLNETHGRMNETRDGHLRRERVYRREGQVERSPSGVRSPPLSTACPNGGFSTTLITGIRVYTHVGSRV